MVESFDRVLSVTGDVVGKRRSMLGENEANLDFDSEDLSCSFLGWEMEAWRSDVLGYLGWNHQL